MSGDIEKLAVFDSRIVQSRPAYAVEKGALSLTNAPFNAIAASPSQHTYNIYVPSENVFVDRAMEWSSTCFQQMTVAVSAFTGAGEPIVRPGRDFALRSFPLNALCSTMTATINDTTTVINTQDVLNEVLRLTDYSKNRLQRTCPTMLDVYQSYDSAFGANNNPLGGYEQISSSSPDKVPNGAFYGLDFTDAAGSPLSAATNGTWYNNGVTTGTTPSPAPVFPGGNAYFVVNGLPVFDGVNLGPYSIYVRWRSTEKLVLSPFVFSDVHERDTGLFGINNIQLIMNMRDISRTIRTTSAGGRTITAIGYNSGAQGGTFQNSVVNVQFLTPSLDVPLPPKSVVPYMEFPRYITQYASALLQPGEIQQLQSQTITLPQIPDLFIIYVKPSVALSSSDADYYLPVATSLDGIRNPLSINFDNFSGLLSSQTAEQLYSMSVKNGLEMDWNQWAGMAHSSRPGVLPGLPWAGSDAGRVPLTGGMLVLKPSQDITLQTGQAPSLVGNFTFQFNLTVKNTSASAQTPVLYVITANSGFFESIRGSSRIIKGVLSEQDIISAPLAPMGTRQQMERLVGSGLMSSLANILGKVGQVYQATKPIHGALGEVGKFGYEEIMKRRGRGGTGAGVTGGEYVGAGATGGRSQKLSARLM